MWRQGSQNPDYRSRWRERFGFVKKRKARAKAPSGRPFLVHCASVGEFLAAKPLLHKLVAGETPVWITCTTPTASKMIQESFGEAVYHTYLPTDLLSSMKRFLDSVDPAVVVLMETEVWPNLVLSAERRRVPVALINARLSEKSFRGYQKLSFFLLPTWQRIALCAVQNERYGSRFETLGVQLNRIQVLGNLKFDISIPSGLATDIEETKSLLSHRQLITAGSTHEGEEALLLSAYKKLSRVRKQALLVIAPRHQERFAEVEKLIEAKGFRYVKRSTGRPIVDTTQVLLVDTMGELLLWYGAAEIAFVGGSLIPRGGHNPIEPMTFGIPIISGRHVFNFEEVYQQLDKQQAVRWVSDEASLHDTLLGLLTTTETAQRIGVQAKSLFALHRGATARTLAALHQCAAGRGA